MQFYLSVSHFTEFYSTVMNCMPIFMEEQSTTNDVYTTPTTDEDFCIICFERRNNTILNCHVRY
jgi:hypothetical protein